MQRKSMKQKQAEVEAFNAKYPPGSQIRIWKGAVGDGSGILTVVDEPGAFLLGGHTPVVKIPGDAIALSHVKAADDAAKNLPAPQGTGEVYLAWNDPVKGPVAFSHDGPGEEKENKSLLAAWAQKGRRIIRVPKERFQELWPGAPMPAEGQGNG